MKNNASLTIGNSNEIVLYDEMATIELFGEEYLNEFGTNIPQDLINRYNKNRSDFNTIQKQLKKHLNE